MWGRIARRALMIAPVAFTAASVPNQPLRSFSVQGLGRLYDHISKIKQNFKYSVMSKCSKKSPLTFHSLCSIGILSIFRDKIRNAATRKFKAKSKDEDSSAKRIKKMYDRFQTFATIQIDEQCFMTPVTWDLRFCLESYYQFYNYRFRNIPILQLIFSKRLRKPIRERVHLKSHSLEMKF